MKAADLLDMVRRCAVDAQQRERADVDARAHAFIAALSGALEQHDAIAADMVYSLLQQPAKDGQK